MSKPSPFLSATALLAIGLGPWSGCGAVAGEVAPASSPALVAEPAAAADDQAPAVRIYVDPATGQRVSRPVVPTEGAATGPVSPDYSRSSEGLVERPLPDGGVIVDLQGRFQSAVSVIRDRDGKLHVQCDEPAHASLGLHTHAEPAPATREER